MILTYNQRGRTEKRFGRWILSQPQPYRWMVWRRNIPALPWNESILHSLRTLHIVWSLVRRRVTRRLTRLQIMYNVPKFSNKWWNNVKKSIYRNRNATAMRLQYNRKFCQFNKDQYCIHVGSAHAVLTFYSKGYFQANTRCQLLKFEYFGT